MHSGIQTVIWDKGMRPAEERDHFIELHLLMRIIFIQVLEKFYVRVSVSFSRFSTCVSMVMTEDDSEPQHWVNGSQYGSAYIFMVCELLKTKVTLPSNCQEPLTLLRSSRRF